MEQMPPQGAQGAPQPPQAEGGSLTEMIIQTDQALSGIAQVLMKASPEAGQALMQLSEQYQQIIQSVLSQAQGQGQQAQRVPQMVSPETQGRPASQAY